MNILIFLNYYLSFFFNLIHYSIQFNSIKSLCSNFEFEIEILNPIIYYIPTQKIKKYE